MVNSPTVFGQRTDKRRIGIDAFGGLGRPMTAREGGGRGISISRERGITMGGKRLLARCAVLAVAVPLFAFGGNVATSSAQERIVGGTAVADGKYTFMASL